MERGELKVKVNILKLGQAIKTIKHQLDLLEKQIDLAVVQADIKDLEERGENSEQNNAG